MVATFAARAATMGDPGYYVDEAFYLLVGERMRQGALLYVDIWDRKAPGLYLFYAMITAGGGGMMRVHLVAAVFVWLTAWMIGSMTLCVLRQAGDAPEQGMQGALLAASVYVLMTGLLGGGGGQSPVFYTLLVVFAVSRLMAADDALRQGRIPLQAGLAMLLAGVGITFKQSAAAEAVFLGAWAVWRLSGAPMPRRERLAKVLGLGLLGAAPILACAGWYAMIGHFDAFWAGAVLSNLHRGYRFTQATGLASHVVAALAIPAGFALVSLALGWRGLRSRADRQLALGWLIVATLAVAAFPNKSEHYFLPIIPPLVLAGAPFLQRRDVGLVMGCWLIVLLAMNGEVFAWRLRDQSRAQMIQLVRYLDAEDPAHRIFIASGTTWPYHALNVRLNSPLVFPMHLVDASERDVSQFVTRRELARVFSARPAIVLTGPPELELAPDAELTGMVDRYIQANCQREARLPLTNMYGAFPVTVHSRCAPVSRRSHAAAPLQRVRIVQRHQPPQRGAGEAFGLDLAAGGGQLVQRGGAQDLGVVAVGHDHAAALGQERRRVQRRAVERRWQAPVEAVAVLEIVGPLAVAQEVRAADLDLDDDDMPARVDPHEVGPPATAQRHFRQAPDVVTGEKPGDAAQDIGGGESDGKRIDVGHAPS